MASLTPTETAILLSTCDKYNPGTQVFKLQSVSGLNNNSSEMTTTKVSTSNLVNKDKSSIKLTSVNKASVIKLELPKQIAMKYPTKFIPPGTRFILSFTSGDITKPVIVGADF